MRANGTPYASANASTTLFRVAEAQLDEHFTQELLKILPLLFFEGAIEVFGAEDAAADEELAERLPRRGGGRWGGQGRAHGYPHRLQRGRQRVGALETVIQPRDLQHLLRMIAQRRQLQTALTRVFAARLEPQERFPARHCR